MVTLYKVGPSEFPVWDLERINQDDRFVWVVYWYREDTYDGSGQAVSMGKDGQLYSVDLGHCSCYGPVDGWATNQQIVTREEVLQVPESIFDYDCRKEIKLKVEELLGT